MSKDLKKENGVVYTPEWVVKQILDLSSFKNNIHDKRVLEPGCGDGAFLTEIVRRMIASALKVKLSKSDIEKLLSDNVFGFDIDEEAIKACKVKLNLICDEHSLKVRWKNIKVESILNQSLIDEYKDQFDFVIGNPPYVRIQNLTKHDREFLTSKLTCCKHGSTDLYIAFFELGYSFLNNNGVLGYITPNSFTNSAAGQALRVFMQSHVEALVDFEHHQVFEDALTYTLITILSKKSKSQTKLYKGDPDSQTINSVGSLDLKRFKDDNWILENDSVLDWIDQVEARGVALGKMAKIHTGLATLKDELFIFKNPTFHGKSARISLKGDKGDRVFEIEKAILKKIIKASTLKSADDDQGLFIIFPYKKVKDKYIIIPEPEMEKTFPKTLAYFKAVRKDLDTRDKGDKDKLAKYPAWYAFGRSQGIDSSFGKKIITSGINLKPNFIVCEDEDSTYYAGYSIHYDGDLQKLADKLNSSDMENYIKYTSKDYQGAYKSYSKSFIEDFGVEI